MQKIVMCKHPKLIDLFVPASSPIPRHGGGAGPQGSWIVLFFKDVRIFPYMGVGEVWHSGKIFDRVH